MHVDILRLLRKLFVWSFGEYIMFSIDLDHSDWEVLNFRRTDWGNPCTMLGARVQATNSTRRMTLEEESMEINLRSTGRSCH